MKAVIIGEYGSIDSLSIQDVEKPSPVGNEVLIKINAVSINDWDWGLLHGSPFIPNRFISGLFKPHIIIGSDIAGIVESVGNKVSLFKPGDEVYGDLSGCGFGGFAEYVCAPQDAVKPKHSGMSFEQAAAIPQAGMLALQGLTAGGVPKPRHNILINGAGGGVGSIAIQLLKLHDVEVTGVDCGAKLTGMRAWGFDNVVDYQTEDFTQNGVQYDLILDVKTDRSPAHYLRALKPNGVYATVGGEVFKLLKIALSGLYYRGRNTKLKVVMLEANRDLIYFNELFEAGKFKPVIDSQYEFTDNDVRDAFLRFNAAAHLGKIVFTI